MTPRLLLTVLLAIVFRGGEQPPYPFDLQSRLEALSPERPRAYFELAEEVLDVAGDDATRRDLAKRLFGLAGVLDPPGLGPSAALALAAMSDDASTSRRFRVVARLLSEDLGGDAAGESVAIDRDAVAKICRALEDFRGGRVDRLRTVLRDPAKVRALMRLDAVIPGGVPWLRERVEAGNAAARDLDLQDRVALVEVEIALLEGTEASWATLISTGTARPLVRLDLDRPERDLLPDEVVRAYWRDGVWLDRPVR